MEAATASRHATEDLQAIILARSAARLRTEVGARTPAAPSLAEATEARAAVAVVAGLTVVVEEVVVVEAVAEEAPTRKCHPRTASHRKA